MTRYESSWDLRPMSSHEDLRRRLQRDPNADLTSLQTTTDRGLSIGRDVWRLRWRGQLTTAVAADADLHATCGALLDALAWLESVLDDPAVSAVGLPLDLTGVNVLVNRPLPGDDPSETDQALRSMRAATRGVTARVWYQRGDDGWAEDDDAPPIWEGDDQRVGDWVTSLLLPRLAAQPSALAEALVAGVDDPSLHLYPSEIRSGRTNVWALRIDGLQIGIAFEETAVLRIGRPGVSDDGARRAGFTTVFGQDEVTVSADPNPPPGELSVVDAIERLRALLSHFRDADVRGAPITHRTHAGVGVVDEHTLEARLLKGFIAPFDSTDSLVLNDDAVARGSQLPNTVGTWRAPPVPRRAPAPPDHTARGRTEGRDQRAWPLLPTFAHPSGPVPPLHLQHSGARPLVSPRRAQPNLRRGGHRHPDSATVDCVIRPRPRSPAKSRGESRRPRSCTR